MIEIVMRQLTKEDAGEALTVQRAAFLSEARIYGTTEIPPLVESLDDMRREIESNFSIGAFVGHRLVGAIRLTIDESIGWISRVAVAPDLHGQGIASSLIAALEHDPPKSVREFRLVAGAKSMQNRLMYERRGYREVGTTTDSAGIELVVMRKART